VNGRSLLRFLPFPGADEEKAGKETENGGPAISPKLIALAGLAISFVAHVAFITPVVIFAGGGPFPPAPPDAITVDIVSPEEVPQPAREPALAETTASESASKVVPSPPAAPAGAQTAMPSAPGAPPPPDPGGTHRAVAAPPSMLPPPPFMPPQPPPAEPPQPDEQSTEPAGPAPGLFGMPLTMPDGTIGGRLDAQAVDRADITNDVVAAFRKHLKTCSTLPDGLAPEVRVVVRIYLNPDGSLATGLPQNPVPIRVSAGGGELYLNAVAALRQCQPYKMLPPDQYPEWKALDLTFTPQNF
jgi:hypothetical protein